MEKKEMSHIGFGLTLIVLLGQVVSVGLMSLAPGIFSGVIGGMMSSYIGMYLIGVPLLLWLTRQMSRATLSKKASPTAKEWLRLSILAIGASSFINLSFNVLFMQFTGKNGNVAGESISQLGLIQNLVIVVILAPIIEELLFRQLFYKLLASFGKKNFIIVSSVCFGLFHQNISQSLYATVLGIVLGGLLWQTGNILYPILFHIMFNFISGFLPMLVGTNTIGISILSVWLLLVISGFVVMMVQMIRKKEFGFLKENVTPNNQVPTRELFLNPGMIVYSLICVGMMVMILVAQLS